MEDPFDLSLIRGELEPFRVQIIVHLEPFRGNIIQIHIEQGLLAMVRARHHDDVVPPDSSLS
jgi:hypothetical protein